MKAISLWQPWATLVATGHKKIETRGWDTKYRGPLLIHAAKAKSYENINDQDPLWKHYHLLFAKEGMPPIKDLPYGAIVGAVNLLHTVKSETVKAGHHFHFGSSQKWEYTEKELAFGDYSPGRFGWLLADAVAFKTPIPYKGMQGFWNYDGPLPEDAWDLLKKF